MTFSNTPYSPSTPPAGPAGAPAGQPKTKKQRRKRSVGGKRTPRLVGLLAFATLTIGGLYFVLTNTPEPEVNEVFVVVTTRSMRAGTTLSETDVEPRAIPAEFVEDTVIQGTTEEEVLNTLYDLGLTEQRLVTRRALRTGAQLAVADFTTPLDRLAHLAEDFQLTSDERLVSIEATLADAVAGAIGVGDRVDVFAYASGLDLATVALTDVRVVDVELPEEDLSSISSLQLEDPSVTPEAVLPADPLPGIYTLVVPADKALDLVTLSEGSTLVLALRTPNSGETALATQSLFEVFCPGVYDELFGADFAAAEIDPDTGEPIETVTVKLPEACREEALSRTELGGFTGFPEDEFVSDSTEG